MEGVMRKFLWACAVLRKYYEQATTVQRKRYLVHLFLKGRQDYGMH